MSVFALRPYIFYKYVFVFMKSVIFFKNIFSYFMNMYVNLSTSKYVHKNMLPGHKLNLDPQILKQMTYQCATAPPLAYFT